LAPVHQRSQDRASRDHDHRPRRCLNDAEGNAPREKPWKKALQPRSEDQQVAGSLAAVDQGVDWVSLADHLLSRDLVWELGQYLLQFSVQSPAVGPGLGGAHVARGSGRAMKPHRFYDPEHAQACGGPLG
jgi:hypothetical protein